MRSSEDPYGCDQVTLGRRQEYAHLEIRKRLLLRMNCRLILLKIVIPVEPVVDKILGVDILGNLKLSLVENLFEYAPGYRFVSRRLRSRVWQNWTAVDRKCRACQSECREQQHEFPPHDRSPYQFM